ncbi:Bifunctional TENA2 protein, partial [Nymphaea thermarum]
RKSSGGRDHRQKAILWSVLANLPWWLQSLVRAIEVTTVAELQRFFGNLMQPEVDHAACMTAFWAIEMVYQTSFQLCLQPGSKTPADLLETCQRWGNNCFKHYCSSLQSIADHCLEKAEEDVLREAEEAFVRVLHNEVGFWNMSYGDAQAFG